MTKEEIANKDFFVPLPSVDYNKVLNIKSQSGSRADVNLFKMECSCNEFHDSKRHRFPIGDIRRMCEHLVTAYNKKIGTRNIDKAKTMMLKEGLGIKQSIIYLSATELNYDIVLNFESDLPWIYVYAENIKGKYVKHSYNFLTKKWEQKTTFSKDITDAVDKLLQEHIFSNESQPEKTKDENPDNDILLTEIVYIPIPAIDYDKEIIVIDDRKKHKINLHKMICDCKDYKIKHRGDKEPGDVRQLCYHLRQEYIKTPLFDELDQLRKYIIKNSSCDKDYVKIFSVSDKIQIAVTYDKISNTDSHDDYVPPRWYNIIALKSNGKYIRYGYNPENGNWSNDKIPELLPEVISSLVKSIDLFRDDNDDDDF